MYLRIARAAGLALVLSSLVSTTAFAALSTAEQKRINDAAGVVTAIRNADNGIPEESVAEGRVRHRHSGYEEGRLHHRR
jgi:hypothetical protein